MKLASECPFDAELKKPDLQSSQLLIAFVAYNHRYFLLMNFISGALVEFSKKESGRSH